MVDHTTRRRCGQRYAPALHAHRYRVADSTSATLDVTLSPRRDADAFEQFFQKVLGIRHMAIPRVITGDQLPAYLPPWRPCGRLGCSPRAVFTGNARFRIMS